MVFPYCSEDFSLYVIYELFFVELALICELPDCAARRCVGVWGYGGMGFISHSLYSENLFRCSSVAPVE